jgi:predicted trehalose synthase
MTTTTPKASATLKAFEDRVTAQVQKGKAKLEQLKTEAKEKGAQSELDAINSLKAIRENIHRKVQGDVPPAVEIQRRLS